MGCKRCGGRLEQFELGAQVATSCTQCGFVDVAVSHGPEHGQRESWADAISRFNDRQYENGGVDDVRIVRSTTADD